MINSCASYIFSKVNENTFILIGKRGKTAPTGAGLYNVPVGMCEYGENPKETAIRETLEETGIDVSHEIFIDAGNETYGNGKIGKNFIFILNKPAQTTIGDGENERFIWVPVTDLDNYQFAYGMDKTIIKLYNKYMLKNISEMKTRSKKEQELNMAAQGAYGKEVTNHIKNFNGKGKITESQLHSIIRNVLCEIYMNNHIDPEDKEYQMQSDWDDIESYGTQNPTDGAYDLGNNPYGYKDMDIDDIYDREEANGNVIDDYGYHGMNAMDRNIKSKVDRDKYSKGNLWTGRRARGENPYSDSTFDDEINRLGLNIEKDKINEGISDGYNIIDVINMLKEALFDITEQTKINKSLALDLSTTILNINNSIKILKNYL